MLQISPLSKDQLKKIVKAFVYSFVSGFTGSFVLVSADVIKAVQGGLGDLTALLVPLIVGAVVAGFNTAFVAIKQLFTESETK